MYEEDWVDKLAEFTFRWLLVGLLAVFYLALFVGVVGLALILVETIGLTYTALGAIFWVLSMQHISKKIKPKKN